MGEHRIRLRRGDDVLRGASRMLAVGLGLVVAQILRQDVHPVGVADLVGEELPNIIVGTAALAGERPRVEQRALVASGVDPRYPLVRIVSGRVVGGLEDGWSGQARLGEEVASAGHSVGGLIGRHVRQFSTDLHVGRLRAWHGFGGSLRGGCTPGADELEIVCAHGRIRVVELSVLVSRAVLNQGPSVINRVLEHLDELRPVGQRDRPLGSPVVIDTQRIGIDGHNGQLEGDLLTDEVIDLGAQLLGIGVRIDVLDADGRGARSSRPWLESVENDVGSRQITIGFAHVGHGNLTDVGQVARLHRPRESRAGRLRHGGAGRLRTIGPRAASLPEHVDRRGVGDVRRENPSGVRGVAGQILTVVAHLRHRVGRVDVGRRSIPPVTGGEGVPIGLGRGQLPDIEAHPQHGHVPGQHIVTERLGQLTVIGGSDVHHRCVPPREAGNIVVHRQGCHGPAVRGEHAGLQRVVLAEPAPFAPGVEHDQGIGRAVDLAGEAAGTSGRLGRLCSQVPRLCGGAGLIGRLIEVHLRVRIESERQGLLLSGVGSRYSDSGRIGDIAGEICGCRRRRRLGDDGHGCRHRACARHRQGESRNAHRQHGELASSP